jgi:hypothetical protein
LSVRSESVAPFFTNDFAVCTEGNHNVVILRWVSEGAVPDLLPLSRLQVGVRAPAPVVVERVQTRRRWCGFVIEISKHVVFLSSCVALVHRYTLLQSATESPPRIAPRGATVGLY